MKKTIAALSLLLSAGLYADLNVHVKANCCGNTCEKTIKLDEENSCGDCSESSCNGSLFVHADKQDDGSVKLHYRIAADEKIHAEGDVVAQLGEEATVACSDSDSSLTFVVTEEATQA